MNISLCYVRLREACVCLYNKMCVVPPASRSEECLWVRWSRSVNCPTCSPPLAGSQRMMGNWAMFSEENQIIRLWRSRRLFLESRFTHFTLTSISIWTKAAQTNAMAANNMPTVILFKGLERKTDSHIYIRITVSSSLSQQTFILSYCVVIHTWNRGHTFWWEGI